MTEPSRDDAVSASGGTMRRLTEPPRDVTPDLALLEPARRTAYDVPVRPAGTPPFFAPGDVVTWHYGMSAGSESLARARSTAGGCATCR